MKDNHFKHAASTMLYLWVGLFIIIPLLLVVSISFLSAKTQTQFGLPLTLNNYKQLFSPLYLRVFIRSFNIALLTTFFCLIIAYPFSYLLALKKNRQLLFTLSIIPFWTSSLVRSYALIGLLKFKGLLNLSLLKLGLIKEPLNILYTNKAVIIGMTYNLLPFMILPLYAAFERFDHKLIDAAKDLGAKPLTQFTHVLIPQSWSGIIAGCTMTFLPAMTLFYIANILGGAKSLLLGNLIENQFLLSRDWPQGAATSTLLTVIMCLILLLYRLKNAKRS